VTEPVARVSSVRRTVTVATALVVSQAVLCVVIGWVTIDHHGRSGSSASAAAPVLGPPVVVPPATIRPVSPTRPAGESSQFLRSRKPAEPASTGISAARTGVTAPTGATEPTKTITAPAPEPPSAEAPNGIRASPSPSKSPIQQGVVPGTACDPAGADGITRTGQAARCSPGRSGDLVWQID
jgi:hypothetical protein